MPTDRSPPREGFCDREVPRICPLFRRPLPAWKQPVHLGSDAEATPIATDNNTRALRGIAASIALWRELRLLQGSAPNSQSVRPPESLPSPQGPLYASEPHVSPWSRSPDRVSASWPPLTCRDEQPSCAGLLPSCASSTRAYRPSSSWSSSPSISEQSWPWRRPLWWDDLLFCRTRLVFSNALSRVAGDVHSFFRRR